MAAGITCAIISHKEALKISGAVEYQIFTNQRATVTQNRV